LQRALGAHVLVEPGIGYYRAQPQPEVWSRRPIERLPKPKQERVGGRRVVILEKGTPDCVIERSVRGLSSRASWVNWLRWQGRSLRRATQELKKSDRALDLRVRNLGAERHQISTIRHILEF
jgi:hypothetical protein